MVARYTAVLLSCAALLAAPQRIISTAPSITEMLYALGMGPRIVADTVYCNYPPEARTKPKIGSYIAPNIEKIASLKPDLVIIQKNPIQLGPRLSALHLNVLEVSHDSIDEVYASIEKIGEAAGAPDRARALVRSLRQELNHIQRRTASYPRTRMMFIVGRAPNRIEDLIAVGRASYLNGVIEAAGGDNIFKDAVAPYPKVGMEDVLRRNPEVIVDMGDMSEPERVSPEQKRAIVALWSQYPSVAAVKNHRVFAAASSIFTVPGPRMVEAARAFASMLHPEAGL
ncbi:MAG TPA: cobalamin-binding protein [Bryobacteraceae bacterium]|nr:cobalamin-binding protein [Bryobacteraceae bacterium]